MSYSNNFEEVYLKSLQIYNHLPIRPKIEEGIYIKHLWAVFDTLLKSMKEAQPFSIMPFHLLFIMSIQYKIKRISEIMPEDYNKTLILSQNREKNKLKIIDSVFTVSLLNERSLGDIFQLINLENSTISKIKELVDYRNDTLAHPKGSVDHSYYEKIFEYIDTLDKISLGMKDLNNKKISLLNSYLTENEYEINKENLENSLYGTEICYQDFINSDYQKYIKTIEEFYYVEEPFED
jgi:hypothetical protein